jgi:DNA-(apurinic or apyrimidinic site) lyase
MKNSKNNKRLVEIKIKRLEKLRIFIDTFEMKQKYYYKNMTDLRNDLTITMNQKIDNKTIVFGIKMF